MPRLMFIVATLALAVPLAFVEGAPAALAQTAQPVLSWAPCGDVPDTECAGLQLPIDYDHPDGAKFTLRLGRAPALDPAKRKGVLLIPPGGPGAGIAEELGAEMREAQHIPELRQQYDVVTFDPRGIGKSSPIRCDPQAAPKIAMPLDRQPTQAEFDALATANAAFFKSCAEATGDLFWHLSSKDTVQDIERIRQALTPNDGIGSYAASYGSEYGAAYLETYPQNVKTLVLDAVMDHGIEYGPFLARNVLSVQDSFERMAQWCARETSCALHGKDLGAVFDAAIAREPKIRTLVPQMLATGDHPELGWPALTQMLAEVIQGESKLLKQITAVANLSTSEDPWLRIGKDGLFRGVICSNYGPQRDYAKLVPIADMLAKAAPRFLWKFWDSSPMEHASAGIGDCVGWPHEARFPPHPLQVGPHRNVMVLNATHDPPTPLANALSIYVQIPEARLLVADADGHQGLTVSKCAYETAARFLDDPEAVPSVTLCVK
jgi:pimeloyl-ACP methyl ester carboxylesterase